LPRKDGREVLAEVKSDPELKTIPIVDLTTSRAEQDIRRSYQLQANCYITKPVEMNCSSSTGLEQFINVVKSIEDFWVTIVRQPNPLRRRSKSNNSPSARRSSNGWEGR
jgi:two-component system, chemotaxis family, response regulator Rcp1